MIIPAEFRDAVLIEVEQSQVPETLERVPLEGVDVVLI